MSACVLCAARGRQTTLDAGLVCPACSVRLADTVDDVRRLAESASVEPRHGRGSGRTVPGSRPPIDVDGVDPALALARLAPPPAEPVPVLVVVEGWIKVILEERGMGPYGPWSAATAPRLAAAGRTPSTRCDDTTATLVACTGFLRAHHEWVVAQDWVDAYAAELRACRRALLRWDDDRPDRAWRIPCPTLLDDGTDCSHPLPVARVDPDEHVHCRRCDRDWDTDRLLMVAGRDADVWVDPEAAAAATGIDPSTLRRWARAGRIQRQHGRYALAAVWAAAEAETRRRAGAC